MSNAAVVLEPEILAPSQADAIVRAEIDVAVATAKRYPRSLALFHEECAALVASDRELCERSYYSLERAGKIIQGPSIRFGELVNYCWRNTLTGVRVIGETADRKFILVQGVGMDMERGTRHSEELPRRITDRHGQRYSDDMIAVTIRAASSIVRREIYLRNVPASVYRQHFQAALAVVVGANEDEAGRIRLLAERAKGLGVGRDWLLGKAKKRKLSDLTEKDLLHLWGLVNAIDDGMLSLAEAFPASQPTTVSDVTGAASRAKEGAAAGTEGGDQSEDD